jgi:hypothetical protein
MRKSHAGKEEQKKNSNREGSVRTVVLIVNASLATVILWGVVFVIAIPQTAMDSAHYAEENYGIEDRIVWSCPIDDVQHELILGIAEADFERSMSRDVMRYGTILDNSFVTRFIEPNDPYVQKIADHISSLYPEDKWAEAALYFVQSSIEYVSDGDLYCVNDFAAYPVETLYLQRGDCEDTSVLLCSIYEALGIRSVLLHYENHFAVGVYTDGDEYLFCETTCDKCEAPRKHAYGVKGSPELQFYGEQSLGRDIADCIASYRNLIDRIAGGMA